MRCTKAHSHEGTKGATRKKPVSECLRPLASFPLPSCLRASEPSCALIVRYLRSSVFICGFSLIFAGCADTKNQQPTTQPMTVKQRQDEMLKDPMGYNPQKDKFDISGGKINEFDKGAFKKDVDNVLNP